MNEHAFCLKTAIATAISSMNLLVFLDFGDAFGTLPHIVMIDALEEIQDP